MPLLKNVCILLITMISGLIGYSQKNDDVVRVEFNSGTRAYREQLIVTKDSLSVIKEDFRQDQRPQIVRRSTDAGEWTSIIESIGGVRLSEIETLQSPTMKRTFDGAAHGSIIITTADGRSFTHGFDDENPHKKFRALMNQIRKLRNK